MMSRTPRIHFIVPSYPTKTSLLLTFSGTASQLYHPLSNLPWTATIHTAEEFFVDGTADQIQLLLKYMYTGSYNLRIFLSDIRTSTMLCSMGKPISISFVRVWDTRHSLIWYELESKLAWILSPGLHCPLSRIRLTFGMQGSNNHGKPQL